MGTSITKSDYLRGLKDGIPIGLGYLPVSMACGVASSKAGLGVLISQLISMFIYSGSGQATVTNLFAGGETSLLIYAIALFVMNCRYMLFSISLSQRIHPSTNFFERLIIGAFNTDEVFGVAIKEKGYITAKYFFGVATIPYICFFSGNLIGSFATDVLPQSVSSALGIMIDAMFIALIVPNAKESKPILSVVLIALGISAVLECIPMIKMHLTSGWIVIICAVLTSLIGAVLFPIQTGEEEKQSE